MTTNLTTYPTEAERVKRFPLLTDRQLNSMYASALPTKGSGRLLRAMIDTLRGERKEERERVLADCGWLGATYNQIASEVSEQIRRG